MKLVILNSLLWVAYSQVYYNIDEISLPRFRFELWNELSPALTSNAESIGYDLANWELMGTNAIEEYSYFTFQDTNDLDRDLRGVVRNFNIDNNNITSVFAAIGFYEDQYDCWVNHYGWYDWDELTAYELDVVLAVLGWNRTSWESENENDYPASELLGWEELSSIEKQAAADLCYLPETWDAEESFSMFLNTSGYLASTEPWLEEEPPAFCFSSHTLVEREDGTTVQMKDLVLGDRVLVSNGHYEPIYSFGHFDTSSVKTEFIQIQTSVSSGLELTPNHLIFTQGKQAVPASSIKIGDKLMMASGETDTVISIKEVTRTGIFAPFTPSGTIVTNGILSSSFATIQESRYVSLGGFEVPLTYHQLGVVFESPHRLLCHLLGSDKCGNYERYNDEGMSRWVEKPMALSQWLFDQNALVGGILFFIAFALLCMVNLMEMLAMNPGCTISLVAAFVAHRRRREKVV